MAIELAVAIVVCVSAGLIALWSSSRRRHGRDDMGKMSEQWVTEHRLGRDPDPNR